MEGRLTDLERRLAQAQRRVRLLFGLVIVAIVAAVGLQVRPGVATAQPQANADQRTVLRAPLDIVGADGYRLMTVEEKQGGGAVARFYGPKNRVSAMIDQTPAGASFGLVTPDDKLGIVLDSEHGGGSLSIYESTQKGGALLRVTTHNGTKFTITDKDGQVLFSKP